MGRPGGGLEGVCKNVAISVTRGKVEQQAMALNLQRSVHGGGQVVGWYFWLNGLRSKTNSVFHQTL